MTSRLARWSIALCLAASVLAPSGAQAAPGADAETQARAGATVRVGWNSYRGVRLGARMEAAARRLGERVTREPCTAGAYITDDGRAFVQLWETKRRNGRVNEISSVGSGAVFPTGLRVGMGMARAKQGIRDAGLRLRHRDHDFGVGYWTRFWYAVGPRGRVIVFDGSEGRVRAASVHVAMRTARYTWTGGYRC